MDYNLKKLLQDGFQYKMSDELFMSFMKQMTEIHLKNNEELISYGKIDTNLYIQKSGVLRNCYFDGENEKIYGFFVPGAPIISYHSHLMGQPAVFYVVACGEAVVLKISKKQLEDLAKSSYEFVQFMLALYQMQPYFTEVKHTAMTGQAKERYLWILKYRSEIIEKVPLKILASYLGITPTHLSRLKKSLTESF